MNSYSFLLFTLFALLFLGCPADDDLPIIPCDNEGYERIDGDCICPEGSFSAYGRCRELKDTEFYGISSECPCVDTLFLWLKKINDDGQLEFRFNDDVFDGFNFDPDYTRIKARTTQGFIADLISLPGGTALLLIKLWEVLSAAKYQVLKGELWI